MRQGLRKLIQNSILLEFELPDSTTGLRRSILSERNDSCFSATSPNAVSAIIYNGIVEFAMNENKIAYNELQKEQCRVIARYLRYAEKDTADTKQKYGFYGEVLLDLILRTHFSTSVILARGYLYSPTDKAEVKGFDAFHIIERDGKNELWLGEAKFYQDCKSAIRSVLMKLKTTFSKDYVHNNLMAIFNRDQYFSTDNSELRKLYESWSDSPEINMATELERYKLNLVYPIFIAYEKSQAPYARSIGQCLDYIEKDCRKFSLKAPREVTCSIFFIFLPLTEVDEIKKRVIKWIEQKEPLIS